MLDWQRTLEQKWATMHFGETKIETRGEHHRFEVQVYLNDLATNTVRVELYADGVNGSSPVRQEMTLSLQRTDVTGGCLYNAAVPATRPATDYTARVIPHCDGVEVPLENARILWQR